MASEQYWPDGYWVDGYWVDGYWPGIGIEILGIGVIFELNSEVIRTIDVNSDTCREFIIIARDETNTNILAKELTSEVHININLETEVARVIDIESIIEIEED